MSSSKKQPKQKVKIKSVPKNIKPLWQQNPKTFALDTSFYPDPADEKNLDRNVRSQYPIADPDEANLEAEKGENIVTPDLENYSIGGKKHSQGGTPLNAEPGSFIFSNDKALRLKGDILNEFGYNPFSNTNKKGVTPGDIAKKYKTNKFLDKLKDPNSDSLDKDTAALMIDNMRKKLAKLAFVQESMKGFPDGMPEIANLPEEQDQMKKGGKWIPSHLKKGRCTPAPNPDCPVGSPQYNLAQTFKKHHGFHKKQLGGAAGQVGAGSDFGTIYGNRFGTPVGGSNIPGVDAEINGRPEFPYYQKPLFRRARPKKPVGDPRKMQYDPITQRWYHGVVVKSKIPNLKPYDVWKQGNEDMTNLPIEQKENFNKTNIAGVPKKNAEPPKTYQDSTYDTGYGQIDYINMAAPYAIGLKKYNPQRINIGPEQIKFNPLDLEAQRQSIKGQAATAYNANGILSPNSNTASVRNSQIFGTSLDPLNQSFMTEFNANQAGKSQVDSQNAQFRTQATAFNAQSNDQYNVRQATVNQNFDDEKRLRLQSFLKGLNTAERSKQLRNAGNVINRDYMITANGQVVRKPSSYDPERQFLRLTGNTGSSQGSATNITLDQFKQMFSDVVPYMSNSQIAEKYFDFLKQTTYTDKNGDNIVDQTRTRNPGLLQNLYQPQ